METMQTKEINLLELTEKLDSYFGLFKDPAQHRFLPKVYSAVNVDYREIFEPGFCELFNGLMLKGGSKVGEVFCISFPTPEVLQEILKRRTENPLIFTHHPIDSETGGRGFMAIELDLLEKLRSAGISIYSLHAPLDCHDEIGTNAAIVQAFGAKVIESFVPYGKEFAGRICEMGKITFDQFIEKVKKIFSVEKVEIGGAAIDEISQIAIVAGGGDEVGYMKEAQDAGCNVYLTGEWHTRVRPSDEDDHKWAIENDRKCFEFEKKTKMSLVAVSHAASEFLVMKTQMVPWFKKLGLKAEAIEQDSWWR